MYKYIFKFNLLRTISSDVIIVYKRYVRFFALKFGVKVELEKQSWQNIFQICDKKNPTWSGVSYDFIQLFECFLSPRQENKQLVGYKIISNLKLWEILFI